ncbi:MAG TPA: LLM class F420-dependent oxidoreductase [Acidimicrobiales bacterium]
MSRTNPSRGITVASLGTLGPRGALDMAALAATLGYDSFWTAEANGAESFALLGAAGAAAPGLALGTGVIPIQVRTPPLAAMAAATLQALHPDRDILLGLGVSTPAVAGRWHGATYSGNPLAQLREYVALVRACLAGDTVSWDGDHYRVKGFRLGVRLGERRPKIVLAALGPRMLRLAGEIADGVLLNYLPASHVAASVAQVRAGGPATVYAYVHAGVVADRADGIDAARRDLYSYAMADGYARMFRQAGFADEVEEIRARHQAGDREGAVAAVSDRMVDAIDFMGDTAEVAAFVRSYEDAGVEVPVLMPLPWGPDRRAVAVATLRAAAPRSGAVGDGAADQVED